MIATPCESGGGYNPGSCQSAGNPTIPGSISSRACVLYGARWILAPIQDVVHLVHGPVDCAYYSSVVRKKGYEVFSTDLREKDVIFGGSQKLERSISEILRLRPTANAVIVYNTCTSGLIGEDVEKVCATAESRHGVPVIPVNCSGFSGTSQKGGHDEAARVIFDYFINRGKCERTKKGVNILGEFNIGGDLDEIESILKTFGITLVCAVSGRANTENLRRSAGAQLNLVHCRSSGGLLAKLMEKQYWIPQIKVSFFGIGETSESLMEIGRFFDLEGISEYIEKESAEALESAKPYTSLLKGKKIAMFFGASRIATMSRAFQELGMEVILAGSQYASKEDYGEADRKLNGKAEIMDDAGLNELCAFLRETKPDLMVGGTREKFIAHKLGIPFLVFPQENVPYAGFRGFVNLAREAACIASAPVWDLLDAGRTLP